MDAAQVAINILASLLTVSLGILVYERFNKIAARLFGPAAARLWAGRGLYLTFVFVCVYIILNIWGLAPFLFNVAVVGVVFFFILWFLKDNILDDFFAGVVATSRRGIRPGTTVLYDGERYTVKHIDVTHSILVSSSGEQLTVPNRLLVVLPVAVSGRRKRAEAKPSRVPELPEPLPPSRSMRL